MDKLRVMLIALAVTFVSSVSATHQKEESIKERTAPSGKVYREGDDVPVAKPAVAEASGPRSGEQVYAASCAMCHGTGIAGAPKMGDSADWSSRISQGEATIIAHAIEGFQGSTGMMPAKGGCATCSDEEVSAAVKHMLAAVQ